jgi:hypothetical protein
MRALDYEFEVRSSKRRMVQNNQVAPVAPFASIAGSTPLGPLTTGSSIRIVLAAQSVAPVPTILSGTTLASVAASAPVPAFQNKCNTLNELRHSHGQKIAIVALASWDSLST